MHLLKGLKIKIVQKLDFDSICFNTRKPGFNPRFLKLVLQLSVK
jgi:hypothetical protein